MLGNVLQVGSDKLYHINKSAIPAEPNVAADIPVPAKEVVQPAVLSYPQITTVTKKYTETETEEVQAESVETDPEREREEVRMSIEKKWPGWEDWVREMAQRSAEEIFSDYTSTVKDAVRGDLKGTPKEDMANLRRSIATEGPKRDEAKKPSTNTNTTPHLSSLDTRNYKTKAPDTDNQPLEKITRSSVQWLSNQSESQGSNDDNIFEHPISTSSESLFTPGTSVVSDGGSDATTTPKLESLDPTDPYQRMMRHEIKSSMRGLLKCLTEHIEGT